jgi:hypothetical protein
MKRQVHIFGAPAIFVPAVLMPAILSLTFLTTCGKTTKGPVSAGLAQSTNIAALYKSMTTSLTAMQVTGYTTSLGFADENWTSDSWGAIDRFACPDSGCTGSDTAKETINSQLDSSRGGVLGKVKKELKNLCYMGALMPSTEIDSAFLPIVATVHTVTVTDAMVINLISDCKMDSTEAATFKTKTVSLTIEDPQGTAYDRYVTLNYGSGDKPYYVKNSDGVIRVAAYDSNTTGDNSTHGISRVLFEKDLATEIFRYEYFSRIVATGQTEALGGDLTFSRGYINDVSKEISFVGDFGKSYYQANHTFIGLSSNMAEINAGAFFSMTAASDIALTGAFVCFKRADGTFVNSSGCTENSAKTRKLEWKSSTPLFVTIAASTQSSWELTTTTSVKPFDGESLVTLAP